VYSCVLLCTPVYSCVLLCTPVYAGVLLCIPVYSCVLLCPPVSSCVLLCPPVYSCVLLCTPCVLLCTPVYCVLCTPVHSCTPVYSCVLLCTPVYSCVLLCTPVYSCVLLCTPVTATATHHCYSALLLSSAIHRCLYDVCPKFMNQGQVSGISNRRGHLAGRIAASSEHGTWADVISHRSAATRERCWSDDGTIWER
jgi:hypothetical protein